MRKGRTWFFCTWISRCLHFKNIEIVLCQFVNCVPSLALTVPPLPGHSHHSQNNLSMSGPARGLRSLPALMLMKSQLLNISNVTLMCWCVL